MRRNTSDDITVLLCGYGGAGKDSVRAILERNHGFIGMAFADGVREEALRENRHLEPVGCRYIELLMREGEDILRKQHQLENDDNQQLFPAKDLISKGYEQAKRKYPCVREYLVDIGHGYREKFGRDYWINRVRGRIEQLDRPTSGQLRVCVSDCRYKNERFRPDAVVWYIERPGVGPANETEAASIREIVPDRIIHNNGSLEDLERYIADALQFGNAH
jgi:hypothetical protein